MPELRPFTNGNSDRGCLVKNIKSSLHGLPKPTLALYGSFHSYHNHRSRRALENFSRSSTPSPLRQKNTPGDRFLTGPKKCPSNLSMAKSTSLGKGRTVRWYMAMAVRTTLTKQFVICVLAYHLS